MTGKDRHTEADNHGENGRVTDRQTKTEDKVTDKDKHTEADSHRGTESGKV